MRRRWAGVGSWAAFALPTILLIVFVVLAGGCGAEDGNAAAPSSSGPAAFPDESWAELAGDGADDLWVGVAGYRRDGSFGLRVFRRGEPGWEELPPPPGEVSQDLPISIAAAADSGGAPCLGYSIGRRPAPMVVCFEGGEWRSLDLPLARGEQLLQIATENGDLVALVGGQGADASHYRLLSEPGNGWVSTPTVTVPPAIARLAIQDPRETTSDLPGIGFATQGRRSQHFVAELHGGGWHRVRPALHGVGTGPLVSGPVVLDGRILYPVTEADAEPWTFTVQTARIGSTRPRPVRLSSGMGNAQGRLDLAGGEVWATWQEHDPREGGGFRAAVFAAQLTPRGKIRRKLRLWHGVSIGPGSIQVVEFQGRTLALYMRSSSDGHGLQVAVRQIG